MRAKCPQVKKKKTIFHLDNARFHTGNVNNAKLEEFVDAYFEDLPQSHYKEGIARLEERMQKCVSVKGQYIEN
jgi:hypothetical protein